ncbi:STAS-like domain-containing protein [Thiomicrorhabdus arctica]|uniref:STAS-like domain-containing protein n=1 Tax=Thiomicrorhabdus arctica TaxID=131540 RepID=UPI000373E1E2|nr:STAS-like domain-containing protein [Thiomicrorhabdus arctica]
MNKKTINIKNDYTWAPAGRYTGDGQFTGQGFREKLLVPALNEYDKVIVELDGSIGYGSSFVEEAFGGLVRESNYTLDQLRKSLEIKTTEFPSIQSEIWEYIEDAAKQRKL